MSQPTSGLTLPASWTDYLPSSSYNAADVLAKLLTVDGPTSGIDAQTASGSGIGVQKIATETDIDNYKSPGTYITPGAGLTNLPSGWSADVRYVLIVGGGVSYASQLIFDTNNNLVRMRKWNGTTWSAWHFDADTVSGYGIGINNPSTIADSLNDKYKGGLYFYDGGVTGNPAGGTYGGTILVLPISSTACMQYAVGYTTMQKSWVRYLNAGSGTWYENWNAASDGPGSGLDADTVSGYGIGTAAKGLVNGDANAITESGLYYISGASQTNTPAPGDWLILHFKLLANYYAQFVVRDVSTGLTETLVRSCWNSTWSSWAKVWNANTDGNGGQPPAPKPTATIGAVGELKRAVYSTPNTVAPAGGTWEVLEVDFGASTIYRSVVSGGATIVGGADATNRVFCWRIA